MDAVTNIVIAVLAIASIGIFLIWRYQRRSLGLQGSTHSLDELDQEEIKDVSHVTGELILEERLEEVSSKGDDFASARVHLHWGERDYARGELEEAIEKFKDAERLFRKVEVKDGIAEALVGLASTHTALGNHSEAISAANEALALSSDTTVLAKANLRLGICFRRRSASDQAELLLNEARHLAQESSDQILEAEVEIALGDVHWKQGNWDSAERHYVKSIKLLETMFLEEQKDPEAVFQASQAKMALGRVCLENQRFKEAEILLLAANDSFEEIDRLFGLELSSQLLGSLYRRIGVVPKSRRWFNESLLFSTMSKNQMRRLENLVLIAELAYSQNHEAMAETLLSMTLSDPSIVEFPEIHSRAFLARGHIDTDLEYPTRAIEIYKKAIKFALKSGPLSLSDRYAGLEAKLKHLVTQQRQALAGRISSELMDWWPTLQIDGQAAREVERRLLDDMPVEIRQQTLLDILSQFTR